MKIKVADAPAFLRAHTLEFIAALVKTKHDAYRRFHTEGKFLLLINKKITSL